ncbi:MAG: hemolysin family protein [Patescibacteria group bacterium]
MVYIIVFFLLLFSAIFSGLTLGYFSLNKDDLKRKAELGDKQAKKIYNIRKDGNLLLCSLLVSNVAVNSTLSIFLGSVVSGIIAGIMATSLIVIFGEVLPQAIFSRYALKLGAKMVWLVRILNFIIYPVCKPMAYGLDKMLGKEIPTVYSKKELIKLVEHHEKIKLSEVDKDEKRIVKGALSFSDKLVKDIMTSYNKIFSLKYDQKINQSIINKIFQAGHSRIPVYKETIDNIVGVLYVKDLMMEEKRKNKTIGELSRPKVFYINDNEKLDNLLNEFHSKRHHLFIVRNKKGKVVGIVSIEDVIEEIIGTEIVDEYEVDKKNNKANKS